MKWPRISIITPSFNQGKFIEETIQSVINQDYPDLKYLVIDGGSKDNTVDIIKKYEDKIDYWVSKPDEGQTDAISKGFRRTSGEIVAWINSDDQYFSKNVLKKVAKFFSENKDIDACCGDNVYIDENNNVLYMRKGVPFCSKRLLYIWNYIHQPTVFMRRKVIEEFALNTSLNYVMDYEYWMRISNKYKFRYINALISASRWHSECKTMVGTSNVFYELKKVHAVMGKGTNIRIIPPQYLFKIFYNIQRLYSLPFLWQLNSKERFPNISVKSWAKLLKRQAFGLRFGG
jgi:glycosyltransferase involved in cell wall biosynthesis